MAKNWMRAKWIYFLQGELTHLIKIGVANHPLERIRDLQAASPDILKLLGIQHVEMHCTESGLHNLFKMYRLHGEWFKPSQIVLNHIRENTLQPSTPIDRQDLEAWFNRQATTYEAEKLKSQISSPEERYFKRKALEAGINPQSPPKTEGSGGTTPVSN